LLWERDLLVHHEVAPGPNGTTFIASKDVHDHVGRHVMFDVIIELGPNGAELSRWSTWDNLTSLRALHPPQQLDVPGVEIPPILDGSGRPSPFGGDHDYYHLNGIQVLPENPLGLADPRFQSGNLLVSFGFVNLLVILDQNSRDIVWSWGPGEIQGVHTARMTKQGTIVLFDNGHEQHRPWSRVVEITPSNGKVVWEYDGNEEERFYSLSMGSAQRLPNGNTLVGESLTARAFEVTHDGDIVWEWQHPRRNPTTYEGAFYRIERYPISLVDDRTTSSQPAERMPTSPAP